METILSSVNDLTSGFQAFKDNQEARLKRLEKSRQVFGPELSLEDETSHHQASEHRAAFKSYIRRGDDKALLALDIAKSLSVGSDVDGGFLIPEVVSNHLHQELHNISPIRQLASVLTISSSAVEVILDQGGEEAGWACETDARNETATPRLAKKRIAVHELYARPRATQKLLEDSQIDVEGWLSQRIARRMAQLENAAFIMGDGVNKPRGFLHYGSAIQEARTNEQFEHLITGVDGGFSEGRPADILINTMASLNPAYTKDAVWVMSRSAHAGIRRLKDQTGHFLWHPALSENGCETLLGYPVVVAPDMPELVAGTASSSIVFGNFKEAYQIVDRAGTYSLRDPYSAKPYIEFYTVKRLGGDVINFEALKVVRFAAE